MKKILLFIFLISIICPATVYSQSNDIKANDIKAIDFTVRRLQPILEILRTKSEAVSPSCIEVLKNIRALKKQMKNNTENNDQNVNGIILRSLYNDALEFCTVDAKNICAHKKPLSIQEQCQKLTR